MLVFKGSKGLVTGNRDVSKVRRPNSISFSELTRGMKEKCGLSNNRVPPSSLEEAFCLASADTGIDLAK